MKTQIRNLLIASLVLAGGAIFSPNAKALAATDLFLEVNEEGTEMAAVTVVAMR